MGEEPFDRLGEPPPGHKDRKAYADRATIELTRPSVAGKAHRHPAVREHRGNGDAAGRP
ncbi:hypothetical protein [Streptomyces pimonensis]|uniref:hypothetical protein n=1 Tax=Streptomyces pimonensis TaxID=2860288 RepID=UPI0035283644